MCWKQRKQKIESAVSPTTQPPFFLENEWISMNFKTKQPNWVTNDLESFRDLRI
jgi:hypothetical protein